ncbi:MAG: hypothetical protein JWO78_154 [Micavibrio sp.]|nr:hypothetical protein [Micavibrio sp.]
MPALAESRIDNPIARTVKHLGIVAGGGSLPLRLLEACDKDGIEPFIVAFDGQTDLSILRERKHMVTRLGAAGLIINTLKSHGIRDLVFIGTIRRPSLKEMRPDFRTLKFFSRLVTRAIGDDGLLKAMKNELQGEGFTLHGIQSFIHDLVAAEGPYGSRKPSAADQEDISRGLSALKTMGDLDIGQSIVVQEGLILGVEAAEGTDDLIKRCGALKRAGRGPILVKASKPGQDQNLDLPTIGPATLLAARDSGFSGIVIEAARTLLIDPQTVSELADEFGIFVAAVKV